MPIQVVYFSEIRGRQGFEEFEKAMRHAARNPDPGSYFARFTQDLRENEPNDEKLITRLLQERQYDAAIFLQDGKVYRGHFAFQRVNGGIRCNVFFLVTLEEDRRKGYCHENTDAFLEREKERGTRLVQISEGHSPEAMAVIRRQKTMEKELGAIVREEDCIIEFLAR